MYHYVLTYKDRIGILVGIKMTLYLRTDWYQVPGTIKQRHLQAVQQDQHMGQTAVVVRYVLVIIRIILDVEQILAALLIQQHVHAAANPRSRRRVRRC